MGGLGPRSVAGVEAGRMAARQARCRWQRRRSVNRSPVLIVASLVPLYPESEATTRIRALLPGWVQRVETHGAETEDREGGCLGQIWVIQPEKSRASGNTRQQGMCLQVTDSIVVRCFGLLPAFRIGETQNPPPATACGFDSRLRHQ
jgi:hypothetical protein